MKLILSTLPKSIILDIHSDFAAKMAQLWHGA